MNEPVRTVRSGIVGLDLALGGGFRFVRRSHEGDRESCTLLIRGGPGVGKSVLAEDLALRLAAAVEGDALYFCVEVLPSEILAQRMGFDDFDPARVVDLSRKGHREPSLTKPSLVLGMLDALVDEQGVPDVGRALLDLHRIATARGYAPRVVVVDSLSEGYGLGTSVPRAVVDGLCKLAVEQGWVLILVEEAATDAPSPWAFAVDTVLSLRLAPPASPLQSRRELLVTKHRFGGCEPGPHGLLIERERVRVIPPFSAYRNAARDLVLPPPAKNRSLAIPSVEDASFPEWFDVPDREGRVVAVRGQLPDRGMERFCRRVGAFTPARARSDGAVAQFAIREASDIPARVEGGTFTVGTLHQLVRGDEWLENALHYMATAVPTPGGRIASVSIGPIERVERYTYQGELTQAFSLLAGLLQQQGLIAVLFGTSPVDVVYGGIVAQYWTVKNNATPGAPKNLPVLVETFDPKRAFNFDARL